MAHHPKSHLTESWLRSRGYVHFDQRVALGFASQYVKSADKIIRHPFLPFIKYIKTIPRYKRKEHKVRMKERPICFAGHLDSHVYSYYAHILSKRYEAALTAAGCDDNILAYRAKGKSNIDFACEIFDLIEQWDDCVVMCFDITQFFDRMNHAMLKREWCKLLGQERLPADHYKVFRSITKYSLVEVEKLCDVLGVKNFAEMRERRRVCDATEFRAKVRSLIVVNAADYGIPQGSPISAVLSNIYLLECDRLIVDTTKACGGVYRRYCDDIIVICSPADAERLETLVMNEIAKLKVEVNREKTERSRFCRDDRKVLHTDNNKPLQYLGFSFDGQRRLIRSSTLSRYYQKMKAAVKRAAIYADKHHKRPAMYRRGLYERFSHLGEPNFISYAYRAAGTMRSKAMRRQVSRHWHNLHNEIEKQDKVAFAVPCQH